MGKARVEDVIGVGEVSPGERLRAIREIAEMTQKEFGELVSIKQGDISAMERGKKPMGLRVARKISDALGIPVTRLIAEEDAKMLRVREVLEKIDTDLTVSLLDLMETAAKLKSGKSITVTRKNNGITIVRSKPRGKKSAAAV
jgi:transcriptional regulator with XRE-family HTH domain